MDVGNKRSAPPLSDFTIRSFWALFLILISNSGNWWLDLLYAGVSEPILILNMIGSGRDQYQLAAGAGCRCWWWEETSTTRMAHLLTAWWCCWIPSKENRSKSKWVVHRIRVVLYCYLLLVCLPSEQCDGNDFAIDFFFVLEFSFDLSEWIWSKVARVEGAKVYPMEFRASHFLKTHQCWRTDGLPDFLRSAHFHPLVQVS